MICASVFYELLPRLHCILYGELSFKSGKHYLIQSLVSVVITSSDRKTSISVFIIVKQIHDRLVTQSTVKTRILDFDMIHYFRFLASHRGEI
jgi:hypothetical protein